MTGESADWYGPESATFGDRVAGAREAAGMTQAQMARRLGVKKSTVVGWEDDVSEPRANKLSMMAGLLNVSIMWLLTGEGAGAEPPDSEEAPDLAVVVAELRGIRTEMRAASDRAARLEKRVRRMMESTG
ncbi:multiprotein-bridging factor 1 family protein [Cribrihabitans sp. XS_ASV171]